MLWPSGMVIGEGPSRVAGGCEAFACELVVRSALLLMSLCRSPCLTAAMGSTQLNGTHVCRRRELMISNVLVVVFLLGGVLPTGLASENRNSRSWVKDQQQ